MNTSISFPSLLALAFVLLLTQGCKIEITVPEGGKVVSASHAFDCASGETCIVEVNDFQFAETFDAHAQEGWVFLGWKFGSDYLCQHRESVCHLTTKGLGEYEDIAAIVESDETYYLEPEFVKGTPFDEALANVVDKDLRACLSEVPPPRKYAEQIRDLRCSTSWGSPTINPLRGIEAFVGIENLSFHGSEFLTDLSPLGNLSRLQHMDVRWQSNYFNAAALSELKLLGHLKLVSTAAALDLSEMGNLKRLIELEFKTASDFNVGLLAGLTNLKVLDIRADSRGTHNINGIDQLAELPNLTVLDLSESGIRNISQLAGLTNLKDLDLSGNYIRYIGPLAGLTNLKVLDLAFTDVKDMDPLAGLTNLKVLDLAFTDFRDMDLLAELPNLTVLDLSGNGIRNISQLAGLTNLKDLDLSSNDISDIGPLAGLDKLKHLDLSVTIISDISPLAGKKELETLYLEPDGSVPKEDPYGQIGIGRPKRTGQISDISPLADSTKLKDLDLGNNKISDISALAGMKSLETLDLHNNNIRNIDALAGNTNLKTLDLHNNRISDIGPLAEIGSIPKLYLNNNNIADVSPLKQHYPLSLDPSFGSELGPEYHLGYVDGSVSSFGVSLDLSYNPIRNIGDALDGIRAGWIFLIDVQSTGCQEYSQLVEQYDSRAIITERGFFGYDFDYYYQLPGRCM